MKKASKRISEIARELSEGDWKGEDWYKIEVLAIKQYLDEQQKDKETLE